MRTLVLLALVAVVHAAVSVSSSYALKTVSQIPGGTSTNIDLTATTTAAFYYTKFDADVFIQEPYCRPSTICAGSSIADCCVACNGSIPLSSPNNTAGCICPGDNTSVCLDKNRSSYTATISRTEYQHYDLGLIDTCHNILITISTTTGEQNLYVNGLGTFDGYPNNVQTYYAYDVGSELPGNDAVSLCAQFNNSGDFTQTFRAYAKADHDPYPHLFISVYGFNEGSYTISFTEATSAQPSFLLPVSKYYNFLPVLMGSTAVIFAGPTSLNTDTGLLQAMYANVDPAYYSRAITAGLAAATYTTSSEIAFAVTLADSASGILRRLWWPDPASCSVNWSSFLKDGSGAVVTGTTTFTAINVSCDLTQLRLTTGNISAETALLAGASDFDDVIRSIVRANTYALSNDVYGCLSQVGRDFLTLPVVSRQENTTQCGQVFGSTAWNNDPCCNLNLLATKCCNPRAIAVQAVDTPVVNQNSLQSCATPECSEQAVLEFATLSDQTSIPSDFVDLRGFTGLAAGCQAATAGAVSPPGFSPDQLATCEVIFGIQRCLVDSDCRTAKCDTSTNRCLPPSTDSGSLATCIVSLMSTGLLADIGNILGVPPNSNASAYIQAITTDYSYTGCFQPLQYNRAPFVRDASLDASQSTCVNAPVGEYCNWDEFALFRSRSDCLSSPYRNNSGYCYAQCKSALSGWCPEAEAAQPTGCFYNYIPAGAVTADCAAAGGELETQEDDPYTCYFSGFTTAATCAPTTRCPSAATSCSSYCYFPTLSLSTCNCSVSNTGGYATACGLGSMSWNTTYGNPACHFVPNSGQITSTQCLSFNSTATPADWWRGGNYYSGALNSQASCLAAGGVCSDGVSASEATCQASSFVTCSSSCTGCSAAQCSQQGVCNAFEISLTGTCVFPTIINPATGSPDCAYSTDRRFLIGCVDGANRTQSECTTLGGQWILRPTTEVQCRSLTYARCQQNIGTEDEPVYYINSKAPAECFACGGIAFLPWRWANATSSPAFWTNYTWAPRQVNNANQWTTVFNRNAFQANLESSYVTRFAQIAATDLSCRYDRSDLFLKAITCDCIAGGAKCYAQFTSESIGATRFCNGVTSTFVQSPALLQSFTNTTFATGCVNVNLGAIGAGRFKQAAVSLYSSLFLKTIVPDPYRFINNSKGIDVAQLVGDGVVVDLSAAASGLQLCIEVRPEIHRIKRLKVVDFAVNSDPYPIEGFRPLELPDAAYYTDANGVLYVCASVSQSATYFPIVRTKSWKTDKYIDTLDKQKQVVPFFVAGALYLVMFLFCVYRLVCVFLWTLLKKGSDSDKGKMLLPKFLLSILLLYLIIRGIYLVLVPVGKMNEAPRVVDLLFAELPTYIYFSLFMLMVFWWIELYNRSTGKSVRTDFLGQMKPFFVAVNVLMYGFFIAVLVVYDHYRKDYEPSSLCGIDTTPSQPRIVDLLPKIYKCIVAGIAAAIAVGFVVYGGMLLWTIGGKITVHSGGSRQRLVSLGVIAGVCSAGLIMQAVLLLIGAFAPFHNTRLAIALTIIAELAPAATLLYFMRQPPLKGHGILGDWFFCCFEGIDDSASTANSQSATRGSSMGGSRASSGGV